MIGRVAGRIEYKADDHVLIDVRGVGYVVYCSDRVLSQLGRPGEAVALYTDLLVREDILQLFGFPTLVEKEWHRLLMSVQGVGAKASLAILGALGPDGVSRAIALGDWNSVKAAKGIGPKTAQRVVNELKDKAPAVMAMSGAATVAAVASDDDMVLEPVAAAPVVPAPAPSASAQSEALSALSNLGYAPGEAASAVAQAAGDIPEAGTPELIRAALKLLAPKG
ncbi:Holliday junction branch migration protein RuvA [Marivita sp. XM-24bin2]|jgi:Holliday junction DNA helicase RuvA|uniref:Holliday junction branch migration protein RuvA n=1 Tax=unclassified Marivita TaxID=2632480 RepID=UPI000D7A7967|nr:Holliday junction branch migration protein RuvA [Marivita sp. XM-24bin2]MCR9109374.1 Holliday junction branch migration protein RuvA [Paracoccaceae bacterium]PWL35454.1 MAG: Holliday junction branch migration protein RuvA [Marivita sp. XM-24bin2]